MRLDSADRWPDEMRVSEIEPRFVCVACGKRGPRSGGFQLGTAGRGGDWFAKYGI
jgi:hypothetical protein